MESYEQLIQEQHERDSIDSRVNAALEAAKVLKEKGQSAYLPADFPKTMLRMAVGSLVRMEARQRKFGLDITTIKRPEQKIQAAAEKIHEEKNS